MKPTPNKTGKLASSAVQKLPATARSPAGKPAVSTIRILVPIDFSKPSEYALQSAARFARRYGGRITLLTVIEPEPYARFEINVLAVTHKTLESRLRSELSGMGNECVGKEHLDAVLVRWGKPFDQIVKTAGSLKSDLIIIATHGHTRLKRVLLGSTAERVIRYAPCPVLTVQAGQKQGWPGTCA